MKAVIIGASGEALHTIEMAHERNLAVTALDGNPGAAGLRAADKGLVVDISNEHAVIEAVRKEGADFVLTVPIGRYLTTIGAVNDALGLPGITRRMAALCTDKYRFHQKLQEKNLRKSRCYALGGADGMDPEDLKARMDAGRLSLDFPAVLKPRFGSGSRGIHMIGDREALKRILKDAERDFLDGEEFVLEECAQGEEYGVDGAVIRGRFYLVLLRKKENTPLPARQAVGYFSVQPQDPFWRQVQTHMKEVADCLGLDECLLHADLIRTDRALFVVELSARPSGHNLHNLFTPLCTGIDMAREYIEYRMGLDWSFVPSVTRKAAIHYFDLEGKVLRMPDEEQVRRLVPSLLEWKCGIAQGEVLAPVKDGHSLMGRGYFILEGEERALRERIKEIKALFQMAP